MIKGGLQFDWFLCQRVARAPNGALNRIHGAAAIGHKEPERERSPRIYFSFFGCGAPATLIAVDIGMAAIKFLFVESFPKLHSTFLTGSVGKRPKIYGANKRAPAKKLPVVMRPIVLNARLHYLWAKSFSVTYCANHLADCQSSRVIVRLCHFERLHVVNS